MSADTFAGDAFWLKHAATLIVESHAAITRQAERLSVAVAWFWTSYLAYLAFARHSVGRPSALEAMPAALLIFVYLAATFAQGPSTGAFDPRAPEAVRTAYSQSVKRRLYALRLAYGLLVVSAPFIAYGIMRA